MTDPTDLGLAFAADLAVRRIGAIDPQQPAAVVADRVKEVLLEYGQAVRAACRVEEEERWT